MEQVYIKNIKEIESYCLSQDWFTVLKEIDQDPIWHAEGNVFIHTNMVVRALWQDALFITLDVERQEDLTWAAFLHDIGKAACTETINERVRSHGHSNKSYRMASKILAGIENLDVERRNRILNLIRFHGRPHYFMSDRVNSDPEMVVAVQSQVCNIQDLYLIAKADSNGRISEVPLSLETLELYKGVAEELKCWDLNDEVSMPYEFANSSQYHLAHRGSLNTFLYVPYENFKSNVEMLSGLPGAGKNWYIDHYYSGDAIIISLDDIRKEFGVKPTDNQGRVIQQAKKIFKLALAAGEDIILNATNITHNIRQNWLGIARDYNANTSITYIEPKLSLIKERNEDRDNAVPEKVWFKMLNKLEIPQPFEANIVLFN